MGYKFCSFPLSAYLLENFQSNFDSRLSQSYNCPLYPSINIKDVNYNKQMNEKQSSEINELKEKKAQVEKQFIQIFSLLQAMHQIFFSSQPHFNSIQQNTHTRSQHFYPSNLFILLQENIKNVHLFCNYVYTLNSINFQKIANYKRNLQTNDQELQGLYKRMQQINQQYESVCHQLSEKQLELDQLKALNKIDISYITSIDLKNSQLAEPLHYPKQKRSFEVTSNFAGQKMNPDESMNPCKIIGSENMIGSIYDLLLIIEDCQNQDFSDRTDQQKKVKDINAVKQEDSWKQPDKDYLQIQKLQYAVKIN